MGLTVRGLPFGGGMRVSHYPIAPGHSDVSAAWEKLGAPILGAVAAACAYDLVRRAGPQAAAPAGGQADA